MEEEGKAPYLNLNIMIAEHFRAMSDVVPTDLNEGLTVAVQAKWDPTKCEKKRSFWRSPHYCQLDLQEVTVVLD